MIQQIPLQATPKQTIDIVLGEQNCTIYLYYSSGKTYMTLAVDGSVINAGMICQCCGILPHYNYSKFSGFLFFLDLKGMRDPIYTEFEDGIYLYYAETAADLAEMMS